MQPAGQDLQKGWWGIKCELPMMLMKDWRGHNQLIIVLVFVTVAFTLLQPRGPGFESQRNLPFQISY